MLFPPIKHSEADINLKKNNYDKKYFIIMTHLTKFTLKKSSLKLKIKKT